MTDARSPRTTSRLAVLLGILTAFGPLSIDMYLPGLPAIGREFGADTGATQLTLSLFFIGLAVGQAFYGPLSDRLGRHRPLLVGCALYALASFGCALATSVEQLIVLRFVQALGGCAGLVLPRSVVRDLFDEHEAARIFSLLMLVMGLAPITAPLIGGQLLAVASWRAIFWLLGGFGLLCLALVMWGLPETLPDRRRMRIGLRQTLAVYGRLLSDRPFMSYALAGGLPMAGMFAYISGSPFVFIERYGVAPTQYGWLFGLNALGLILASQLNRWLLSRYRGGAILAGALALHAAAGLALALVAALELGGLVGLLGPLFLVVASLGLVQPNATAAAMARSGPTAGSASAVLGVLQFTVGAGAGALVGALHDGTAMPMAGIIAACGVAGFLSLQLLRGHTESPAAHQAASSTSREEVV
jgi:DHA1 family bicyclomycin/chloramphenicol resistance-like MFS transporter